MAKAKRSRSYEKLDATPVAIPMKFKRPETLAEQVRNVLRGEMSRYAENQGFESFEEADDFDVEDEYNPRSPHEMEIDQELEGYDWVRNGGRDASESVPAEEGDSEAEGEVQSGGKGPPKGGSRPKRSVSANSGADSPDGEVDD